MNEVLPRLAIGDVAQRAGMSASWIRYYEARGLLPSLSEQPGSVAIARRCCGGLAIIDAAQRVGFTLEEIRHLLGSRDEVAHERLRQLALLKLPQLDDLIARATSVRRVLRMCSQCDCESIDGCRMFDERALTLPGHAAAATPPRAPRGATGEV